MVGVTFKELDLIRPKCPKCGKRHLQESNKQKLIFSEGEYWCLFSCRNCQKKTMLIATKGIVSRNFWFNSTFPLFPTIRKRNFENNYVLKWLFLEITTQRKKESRGAFVLSLKELTIFLSTPLFKIKLSTP